MKERIVETIKENLCVRRVLLSTNIVIGLLSTVAWIICYFTDMSIVRYWEGIAVCAYCNILLNTRFYWEAIYSAIKNVRKEDGK